MMPFSGGLSPTTDKSVIPTNNVVTIQDVLDGRSYKLPGGGGDWSSGHGEDTEKAYKEKGTDYKRMERDWEIMSKMLDVQEPTRELWKVKTPGGSRFFGSFNGAARFQESLRDKGINGISLSRVASKNDKNDTLATVADAMQKCFKTEALDINKGVKELGSAFCVAPKYFITCAHCVKKYDKNQTPDIPKEVFIDGITINLIHNGARRKAEVVAVDTRKDIALLTSDIESGYFELDLGPLLIGEEIMSVGSPHGYENNVSTGTLGSLDRQVYTYEGSPKYMFVDLSIFSGNSGGPILRNISGKVIGMVTLVVSDAGGYGLNAGMSASYIEKFCMEHIPNFGMKHNKGEET
ncbi:MAG: serine protease [Methanomassiliicoccales archaeon]|jgi:S1-C subfamily serine protease